jgi:hypothetical protein
MHDAWKTKRKSFFFYFFQKKVDEMHNAKIKGKEKAKFFLFELLPKKHLF